MQTNVSAMLAIIAILVPGSALGQECPSAVSMQCPEYADKMAAGVCLKPGSIFVLKDKWEPAERAKFSFNDQKDVQFFYVIDGTHIGTKYDVLFVSIDRVGQQTDRVDVKLTQNRALKFKTTEDKEKYSRAVKSDGQPTQPMRQWRASSRRSRPSVQRVKSTGRGMRRKLTCSTTSSASTIRNAGTRRSTI
jgi:hypothetical protein